MSIKHIKGFTLIELMIVIAIVAILVALAVPAYQDYTIRTKIGECVNNAAVPKLQISEYRETTGSMPDNVNEAGIVNSGLSQYCDGFINYTEVDDNEAYFEIDVAESRVDSTLSTIQPRLTGQLNGSGGVDWRCSKGAPTSAVDLKYLPSTCRGPDT